MACHPALRDAADARRAFRVAAGFGAEGEAVLFGQAAGHGGADPGAARGGLVEKDVTLAFAQAVAARQIGEPSFPADVWPRDRARWSASIKESLTRPATVANPA